MDRNTPRQGGARETRRGGYWTILPLCLGIITVIFGGYELIERRWLLEIDMELLHTLHRLRGILSSLVVAMATAWVLLKRVAPAFPPPAHSATSQLEGDRSDDRHRWQAAWLIQMRWLAILVIASLIVLAGPLIHLLPGETFLPLFALTALLAVVNTLFRLWSSAVRNPHTLVMIQIAVDLVVLTGLLHFSGGLENPLHAVYLFHVIIAGVILSRRSTYQVALVSAICLLLLGIAELQGWVGHYTIAIFPHRAEPTSIVTASTDDAREHETDGEVSADASPETHATDQLNVAAIDRSSRGSEHEHATGEEVHHAAHDPLFVGSRLLTFIGVLGLTAYFTTLTVDQLRQREEQLVIAARKSMGEHRKLAAVVDAAGAGMILLSGECRIRWFNNRLASWFGLNAGHLGQDFSSTPMASYRIDSADGSSGAIALDGALAWERSIRGADGKERILLITSSSLIDEDGDVAEIVELVQDITERKAVEAELVHAGKMASLGRLTAGIAHEIGNPLSSLSTRLQLLEERSDPEFVRESLGLIHAQIDRIARIVHGIGGFSRSTRGAWGAVDVNAALTEAASLLKTDARAQAVEIRLELDIEVPPTLAVKDELTQVFLNVGINGLEAMPGGGVLVISSRRGGNEIEIRFRDSGEGMTDEVRSQLFTPFFTTRLDGTGLGLSLSHEIVQAHDGNISARSEPGVGSIFLIQLPMRSSRRAEVEGDLSGFSAGERSSPPTARDHRDPEA